MINYPFLSTLILLPLIGALFIFLFIRDDSNFSVQNMTIMAFWTTILNFIISVVILAKYDFSASGFQFTESHIWISKYDIGYRLGIDGISLLMIVLTTALMPICILCSKNAIKKRHKEYFICFLLLESFIIGTFASTDLLLFYIFFEVILIPMYLIIGIWGGKNRIYAAYKFFLYTLFGSILFLLAIIVIVIKAQTTDIVELYKLAPVIFSFDVAKYLWLALFIAFAVKVPMWPFHTWLPDAHVQAPTAGSVILAAVLLKIGAYGLLRFSLPMFPEASYYFKDFVIILSLIAIIYTSIVAFIQTDIKKLVAYSSVAHMGYVTLGIFTFTEQGLVGAVFQMVSHGIISGALFISIGVIYNRLNTRNISEIGGLASVMPHYSFLFIIFMLGSVALPATSGFVGEFLILLAAYQSSPEVMIFAAVGVILGAIYMLWLAKQLIMGEPLNKKILELKDLNVTEGLTLLPLAILVIYFGIQPAPIINMIELNLTDLLSNINSVVGK
ncbi:MAG: NADH-quinone oxidoreductase subunit M [Alphaproteobacteria bacterium]|nr:NADH-quinone oxidoreductase subunit M [Alphaproteobacteria bacterium]MBT5828322.1 NADH-quinone oxidoreductase subunit M [Alphaproteobacteria bacterium]